MRRAAALLLVLAACSTGRPPPPPAANSPTTPGPLYVAVGASETTGIGAETPLREAWPRVLFRTVMPTNAAFVNLGIPGATVATALRLELPQATQLQPDVVTVWLNVNDILAGVPPADFERDLGALVRGLRRTGQARVLVANAPPVDHLPAYRACRPAPPAAGPECRAPGGELPPPEVVNQLIAAYNAATARVAAAEGATLVDLHAVGMEARAAGIEAALISGDGFHPNAGGYQRVATAFAQAYQR